MAALLATHRGLLLFTSTTVCKRLFGSLPIGFVPFSLVKEMLGLHLSNSPFIWRKFGVGWKDVFSPKRFAVLTTSPSCYGFRRSDLRWAQLRWSSGLNAGVWKGHSGHFGVPFLTFSFQGKWLFQLYSVCVSALLIRVRCGCDSGFSTDLCVKCSLNLAFQLPPETSPREQSLISLWTGAEFMWELGA